MKSTRSQSKKHTIVGSHIPMPASSYPSAAATLPAASHITPTLVRAKTMPFEQQISDCIKKAHSRLLSNYFCYLLSENDPSIINKITFAFDKALDKYVYVESPTSKVKEYGGDLNDALGQIVDGLKKITNIKETIYKNVFNASQKKNLYYKLHKIAMPETEYEDNLINVGFYFKPGEISSVISEFCRDSIKYDHPNENIFVSYFCVSILLVPSFYYWFSRLDNTNTSDMDPELKQCVDQEVKNVDWVGRSSIDGKYVPQPNGEKLTNYLTRNNLPPANPECFGWEGHEIVVKGYDPTSACYFIQNSWGPNWNKTSGRCSQPASGRWISKDVLDKVVYGVLKIVFPPTNVFTFGQGITKRKRKRGSFKNAKKPNKSKKTKQSRNIKSRRL